MEVNKDIKNKMGYTESPWISDMKKQFNDFIKNDDKKYILLFELISQANPSEAEIIEHLLLKTIDKIKEVMLMKDVDVYNERDLADANFLLRFIKLVIQHDRNAIDMHHPFNHGWEIV